MIKVSPLDAVMTHAIVYSNSALILNLYLAGIVGAYPLCAHIFVRQTITRSIKE